MTPKLIELTPKQFIGISHEMNLIEDKTGFLWQSFMPRRKEIVETVSSDYYNIRVHDDDYFEQFRPDRTFVKWAALEVANSDHVPEGMEAFQLPGGLYAVFHYTGSSRDPSIYQYIYGTWVPQSSYRLDNRPHFEVMGEYYKNDSPESQEEIWVPVTN